jgi:Acyl-CoA reductase (LuxC).
LSAHAVLELGEDALRKLCLDFFNDTYLVDQNACSSPNVIFWQGSPVDCKAARVLFWDALGRHLSSTYKLDPLARIDRSLDVMALVGVARNSVDVAQDYDDIWLLSNSHLRGQKLRFGMFLEIEIDELAQLSKFLRDNEQTLSVFGVDQELVFDALKADMSCVDRIVPVGRALDIGFNWDGREMLSLFSKKIQVG